MTGQSLIALLDGEPQRDRDRAFVERERHAQVREGNLGYPSRAVRTRDYLYIRNFAPERWPAGDPAMRWAVGPFGDVDHGPSKDFILAYRDDPAIAPFYTRAFARRPAEELYALAADPDQLTNVIDREDHRAALGALRESLTAWMRATADPRAASGTDVFSAFPYFGPASRWPGSR